MTTVSVTPTAADTVPGVLTPNGNTNLPQTLTYNSFLGLTSATGPNGAVATTNYDAYGRVASAVSVHGATTTYAYDYVARTRTATTGGPWVKATMDGLGRTIKVEKGRDCPPGSRRSAETLHEDDGNKYNEGYHWDYVHCDNKSWKIKPDGTKTPAK